MMDEEKYERMLLKLGLLTFLIDTYPRNIVEVDLLEEKSLFESEVRKVGLVVTFTTEADMERDIANYFAGFINSAKRRAEFLEKERDKYGIKKEEEC